MSERMCDRACDYCQPDAWHGCTLSAGHEGYHSCTGYVALPVVAAETDEGGGGRSPCPACLHEHDGECPTDCPEHTCDRGQR